MPRSYGTPRDVTTWQNRSPSQAHRIPASRAVGHRIRHSSPCRGPLKQVQILWGGGTRLTDTSIILLHGLFADGLERFDRLAPTFRRWGLTVERQAAFRTVAFFCHGPPCSRLDHAGRP